MKNKSYIRLTCYHWPSSDTSAAHLADLACALTPGCVIEGLLLSDIKVGDPVRIHQRFLDGAAASADYTSLPVIRIEYGYVMTADALFQVLRVPGPSPIAKPANDVARATVPPREYLALQENIYTAMADLAPDLALVAALFALHEEQFTQLRRDLPDQRTRMPFSIVDLDAEFMALQDGLCFRYSIPENRDKRQRDIWIAGHQCLLALRVAVSKETAFLAERGDLAVFTSCHARLMRLLQAWQHFAALLPAPEATYGQDYC